MTIDLKFRVIGSNGKQMNKILTRRPTHLTTTEQVKMNMENCLTTIVIAIYD
jgi:hypothetical protein